MSLVGSLEDLNLGDILQIISLSQKSGVLVLRTSDGGGRIVFVGGLVRGAAVKGGPQDLRGVLVGGGFLDEAAFDAAQRHARSEGSALDEAVARVTPISGERIQSLCREAVESAVVTMFSWQRGEFSFDVRTELESEDPELLLPTGINAQYLAMEGARLRDEAGKTSPPLEPSRSKPSAADHELQPPESFAGLAEAAGEDDLPNEPPGAAEAIDFLAQATLEHVEAETEAEVLDDVVEVTWEADDPGLPDDLLDPEPLELDEVVDLQPIALEQAPEPAAAAAEPDLEPELMGRPLVAIDEDLTALEWVKQSMRRDFARIHIFQRSELGLARIRQYLVRGQIPLLLISPRAEVDPLSGIRGAADFVRRLKAQSARLVVLWLCEEGTDAPADAGPADGLVTRPDSKRLQPSRRADKLGRLTALFRKSLLAALARAAASPHGTRRHADGTGVEAAECSPDNLRRLRDATRLLSDASSRGEVLPLVMRFAAESFSRVAMFMVRDETAVGMAQSGLALCGGPDDEALREISVAVADSAWMRAVLQERRPFCGAPTSAGDRRLGGLLGNRLAETVYLAPIESAGQVIAFLYGDNLPSGQPIGDTSGLEVVLHHAGLALDRAALERALRESGPADA